MPKITNQLFLLLLILFGVENMDFFNKIFCWWFSHTYDDRSEGASLFFYKKSGEKSYLFNSPLFLPISLFVLSCHLGEH